MATVRKAANKRILFTGAAGNFGSYFFTSLIPGGIFMTDVAGISVTLYGIVDVIRQVSTMLAGPLSGLIIDRSKFKSGKYAPWIMISAVVLSISAFFMFGFGVFGLRSGQLATKVIYIAFFFVYNFALLFYTSANIGFLPDVTEDPAERTLFATARGFCLEAGKFVGGIYPLLLAFFQPRMGGDAVKAHIPITLMMIAILLITSFLTALEVKKFVPIVEHPHTDENGEMKELNMRQQFSCLAKNRALLLLFIITFCTMMRNVVAGPLNPYYFRYVAGNFNLFFIYNTVGRFASLGAMAISPIIVKFGGLKPTLIASAALTAISQGCVPLFGLKPLGFMIAMTFAGFFLSINSVVMETAYGAASDYGEWKNGENLPAAAMSIQETSVKASSLVAIGLRTWLLNATGFKAGMEPNPRFSRAFVNVYGVVALFLAVGAVCSGLIPYNDQKILEIRQELNARREGSSTADEVEQRMQQK